LFIRKLSEQNLVGYQSQNRAENPYVKDEQKTIAFNVAIVRSSLSRESSDAGSLAMHVSPDFLKTILIFGVNTG
jgi:hypothetical protein